MTRETFHRGAVLSTEQRLLPAPLYKKIVFALDKAQASCAFVSIRAMQYLAVIDHEEVIFVGAHARHQVAFAWQAFQNHQLENIQASVPYTLVCYIEDEEAMARVQFEFEKALDIFIARLKSKENLVIPFPGS